MNKEKYNIALISTGHPEAYIELANIFFKENSQGYLLGQNSFPHITLCQFMSDRSILPFIIVELEKVDRNPPIHLTGLRFSNKYNSNLWAASLSVERTSALMNLLQCVVDILYHHNLVPLNPTEDLYTHHLTLAGVNGIQVKNFSKDIFMDDLFNLALGESDELGQFTKILHQF